MPTYEEAIAMLDSFTGGNTGRNRMAYANPREDILHPALVSDELIQAGKGAAVLGELPQPNLEAAVADCGTDEAEEFLYQQILGMQAPAPIDTEFVFFQAVQKCGDLYPVYLAFRAILVDKKESITLSLSGVEYKLAFKSGQVRLKDQVRQVQYLSEDTQIYDWHQSGDVLIWVQGNDGEVEGYILNGWVYLNESKVEQNG